MHAWQMHRWQALTFGNCVVQSPQVLLGEAAAIQESLQGLQHQACACRVQRQWHGYLLMMMMQLLLLLLLQSMVLALENRGATSDMAKWFIFDRSKGCKCKRGNAVCTTS